MELLLQQELYQINLRIKTLRPQFLCNPSTGAPYRVVPSCDVLWLEDPVDFNRGPSSAKFTWPIRVNEDAILRRWSWKPFLDGVPHWTALGSTIKTRCH